jgi:GH15 family glucan-1,4-alpha-glucosidase
MRSFRATHSWKLRRAEIYRPMSDDAIIGNAQTVALIGSQGSIDWACLPSCDSAATFLRLLHDRKGGYCAV